MAGVTGEQDWYVSGVFNMSFINLNDTFGDYVDRAGSVPKVNDAEDTLIPSDIKIDSHADRHKQGGADELDVAELSGAGGSDGQVPVTDGTNVTWIDLSHDSLSGVGYNDHHGVGTGIIWDDNNVAHDSASVHESGGALELTHNNLALSSDDHHNKDHASRHEKGGADEIIDKTGYLLYIEDQKASGTSGGDFDSGAWRVRDLNTVVVNDIGGASLSANEITLPAGTFEIEWATPANQVNWHKSRVFDVTNSVVLMEGGNECANNSYIIITRSYGFGRFSLTASANLRIEHQGSQTIHGDGFGVDCGSRLTIDHETYTRVKIRKVA